MGGIPEVPRGVDHGDELFYMFDFGQELSEVDKSIVKNWVDIVYEFMKTGGHAATRCGRGMVTWHVATRWGCAEVRGQMDTLECGCAEVRGHVATRWVCGKVTWQPSGGVPRSGVTWWHAGGVARSGVTWWQAGGVARSGVKWRLSGGVLRSGVTWWLAGGVA
ncbi:hypothetical protein Fcan01_26149, partial [Folsomia candida]